MDKSEIRVLGLGGSLRQRSRSLAALRFALQACELEGVKTTLLDINQLDLPLYRPGKVSFDHPGVKSLTESIAVCNALLISSPVYEETMSGTVKNALDFIHDMDHQPTRLSERVAGVIAVAEGSQNAACLAALHTALSAMGASVVPSRVGLFGNAFDTEANLCDPIAHDRLVALAHDLLTTLRFRGAPKMERSLL